LTMKICLVHPKMCLTHRNHAFRVCPLGLQASVKVCLSLKLCRSLISICMTGSTLDHSVHNQQSAQPLTQQEDDDEPHKRPFGSASKRTRTTSPGSVRRSMEGKRAEREKGKQERWSRIMANRKVDRDRKFMNGILNDVPEFNFMRGGPNGFDKHAPGAEGPPGGAYIFVS